MSTIARRAFLEMAAAMGATAAWGSPFGTKPVASWRERRDRFPEGVASGDPDSNSVLLWMRRPPVGASLGAEKLISNRPRMTEGDHGKTLAYPKLICRSSCLGLHPEAASFVYP